MPARLEEFGKLLHESWTLKRGLANGTSTSTIDRIYDDAKRAGALGGKLLGAGGTGFMVFVVPPGAAAGRRQGAVAPHHRAGFGRFHGLDDRLPQGRAARRRRLAALIHRGQGWKYSRQSSNWSC